MQALKPEKKAECHEFGINEYLVNAIHKLYSKCMNRGVY